VDLQCKRITLVLLTCLRSTNVTVPNSQDRVDPSKLNIPKGEDKAPAPIDPSIDKWFYISGASA
jgi:inorganic pyrophosphatase